MNQPLKILYAFQGTGNGHVARARDLIPRFAAHGTVDVLIAGTESNLDVGVPIRYNLHGLTMVYDKHGRLVIGEVYGTINWSDFVLTFSAYP